MKIVFVRHGKSETADANKRQAPSSKLGKMGKKQALLVANRIKKSSQQYDMIISSPWTRALQTAQVIAKKTGLPLLENPLIHEFLSNSILHEQPAESEIIKEYLIAVEAKGVNFDWKFKDGGECVRDVINRAIKFKNELTTNHLGKNYLVVSHGFFITTFITLLIVGDNYDDLHFKQVSDLIHFENTSLTHLEYDEGKKQWKIEILNDHNHLKLK